MGWIKKWEEGLYRPAIIIILMMLIALPYINPIGLPLPIGDAARTVYEGVEALEPGSIVWLFGPVTAGHYSEVGYTFEVMLKQIMDNDLKVVIVSNGADTTPMYFFALDQIENHLTGKTYGEDWCYLGWMANPEAELSLQASDFRQYAKKDFFGTSIDDIPMLDGINNINDFDLVMSAAGATNSVEAFIRQICPKFDNGQIYIAVLGNVAPFAQAYVPDPISAVLISMRSTAEYEYLTSNPSRAIISMDAQSLMLLFFVSIALGGNVVGYLAKRQGERN